jgi:hypothetical protein
MIWHGPILISNGPLTQLSRGGSFTNAGNCHAVLDLDRTGLDLTHESNPTRKSKLELLELLERQLPNTES